MMQRRLAALCLAAALLASPGAISATKLPTDGEVRHAMSEIRELVAAAVPAARDGKLGPADCQRLSDAINDRLQQASARNRLPPEIRGRLDTVLAPLAKAARSLKAEGERALPAVVTALEDYDRAVDHPTGLNR